MNNRYTIRQEKKLNENIVDLQTFDRYELDTGLSLDDERAIVPGGFTFTERLWDFDPTFGFQSQPNIQFSQRKYFIGENLFLRSLFRRSSNPEVELQVVKINK